MKMLGADTSHWNGDTQFSNLLNEKDIEFIFLKATEGVTYTDPKFNERARRAIEAGKKVGFYHFARPENNAIAKREAENFLDAVEDFGNKCIYALDWEGSAEQCDPFWIKKWCSFIEQKTNRKPMLYCNYSYANNLKTNLSDIPLWVAKWGSEPEGNIGFWNKYTIWQYSAQPVDMNIFNGTANEFLMIGKKMTVDEQEHYCGCCCCKNE